MLSLQLMELTHSINFLTVRNTLCRDSTYRIFAVNVLQQKETCILVLTVVNTMVIEGSARKSLTSVMLN